MQGRSHRDVCGAADFEAAAVRQHIRLLQRLPGTRSLEISSRNSRCTGCRADFRCSPPETLGAKGWAKARSQPVVLKFRVAHSLHPVACMEMHGHVFGTLGTLFQTLLAMRAQAHTHTRAWGMLRKASQASQFPRGARWCRRRRRNGRSTPGFDARRRSRCATSEGRRARKWQTIGPGTTISGGAVTAGAKVRFDTNIGAKRHDHAFHQNRPTSRCTGSASLRGGKKARTTLRMRDG